MRLDGLFGTFEMLADVESVFEATEIKHRLRRLGFEPAPRDGRYPLAPNAFFGDTVLTRRAWPANAGVPVAESDWVCYSGVVVAPMLTGFCSTEIPGRPELQVGLVVTVGAGDTTSEDRFRSWPGVLGSMWVAVREGARRSVVARQDALDLIEATEDDHLALRKARDQFFTARWNELAWLPEFDERWLAERA